MTRSCRCRSGPARCCCWLLFGQLHKLGVKLLPMVMSGILVCVAFAAVTLACGPHAHARGDTNGGGATCLPIYVCAGLGRGLPRGEVTQPEFSYVYEVSSAQRGQGRRHILAQTFPTTSTNGSASATFPDAAFGTWCASNAACTAEGNLTLYLKQWTDASPFTSVTVGWPNVFSGPGVSGLQLASAGVVQIQFNGYAAKADQLICDASTSCAATLTIPLAAGIDVTKSFVCMRLEPTGRPSPQ